MFKLFIAASLSASFLLDACSASRLKFQNVSAYREALAALQHPGAKGAL